jgi:mannose-6-phosphate isomerase-like protein (cupin superfamily)
MNTLVSKPWGSEEIWAQTDKYVGKILYVRSGESLSRQYHVKKMETLRVLKGHVIFELGESDATHTPVTIYAMEGTIVHLPPGTIHRIFVPPSSLGIPYTAEILEVSTTELDDVVRLQDMYGRVESKDDKGNRVGAKK